MNRHPFVAGGTKVLLAKNTHPHHASPTHSRTTDKNAESKGLLAEEKTGQKQIPAASPVPGLPKLGKAPKLADIEEMMATPRAALRLGVIVPDIPSDWRCVSCGTSFWAVTF